MPMDEVGVTIGDFMDIVIFMVFLTLSLSLLIVLCYRKGWKDCQNYYEEQRGEKDEETK